MMTGIASTMAVNTSIAHASRVGSAVCSVSMIVSIKLRAASMIWGRLFIIPSTTLATIRIAVFTSSGRKEAIPVMISVTMVMPASVSCVAFCLTISRRVVTIVPAPWMI